MGVYTKDQLLARLKELQIEFASCTHPAVLTVEAQAKYVGHLGGGISKNLFLKDKKHRYYIISALAATTVDLKVLSQRLGLGKGGLRMAPEEALQEILKVSLGCVTPFATMNESAQSVSLLLDEGFKAQQGCLFHPLSNEMTISLNSRDLDKFLISMGRKPVYVDMEAAPLVGKDQPPDLAFLIPSGVPKVDQPEKDEVSSKIHISEKNTRTETIIHANNKKKSPEKLHSTPIADVRTFVDELIERMSASVLSEIAKETDKEQKELPGSVIDGIKKYLGADFSNLAMSFKNAAYTEGFHSGIQSVLLKTGQNITSYGK